MTRLEKKVDDLEKRLKTVESRTNSLVQPFIQLWPTVRAPHGMPQTALPNSRIPEIWGRGEVNGWPYLIVPTN